MTSVAKGGLEDVVATSSAICYLDGERGVLAYCGYDIHDLARGSTFEEVCYLLWHRRLPTRAELGDLQSQLSASRALPEPIIRLMRSLPPVDGMDALRTITSALAHYDAEVDDSSPQAQYRKAVRLTAQTGTVVAASDTNIQASRHTDGSTSEPSLPPPEVRGAGQEAESSDSSGGSTRNDRPS